jgi:hypothetical protein
VTEFPKKWSGVAAPRINFFSVSLLALAGKTFHARITSNNPIAIFRVLMNKV